MNNIINENKKTTELIRKVISKLYEQMNKQFNELKININNNQEIKYNNKDILGRNRYRSIIKWCSRWKRNYVLE